MSEKSTPSTRFDGFTNDSEQRQTSHNVPAVRFTADDGSAFPAWEEKKLGDLCESIASGKTRKSTEGHVPLWGSSGLLGHTKEAEFEGDYLLIGRVGAAGSVRHYVGEFSASDNTLVIQPILHIISSLWLTGFLKYFNLNRLTFGSSQPLITATQLKRLRVFTPKLQEQQKIASLLSSVDETLALCQRKLDLFTQAKKALMQQIFSRKLCFNADDGSEFPEWEEKKLGDLCHITTGSRDANAATLDGRYKFFTCAREDYLIDDYSFNGLAILVAGNGDVGHTKIYEGKFDAYQRTYVLMNFSENPYYLKPAIDFYLPKRVHEGLNMGAMPYIRLDTLAGLNIPLPSSVEQQKIAACLRSADALIDQARVELEQWREVKKSLLQQLFV